MVEAAAGALELFGASLPGNTTGPALVRHLLDRAAANGFTVVRAWAHAVSPQYALQVRWWGSGGGGWSNGKPLPAGGAQRMPACLLQCPTRRCRCRAPRRCDADVSW